MAKKTGFLKTLGRQSYTVIHMVNKLDKAPFKEIVSVLSFCHEK